MRKLSILFTVVLGIAFNVFAQEKRDYTPVNTSFKEVKQFKPIMRGGKPFFPIGSYSLVRNISKKRHAEMGWNVTMVRIKENKVENDKMLSEFQKNGIYVIASFSHWMKRHGKKYILDAVKRSHEHPAIFGYYIFDEPENSYHREFRKKYPKRKMALLPEYIAEKIGWMTPEIRKIDKNPENYIMMCIAWWNTYNKMQKLCDLNMANQYPTKRTSKEFEGRHAEIVYDARCAAEAAAKYNRRGFIYTSFGADLLEKIKEYRAPTLNEFRYSMYAPLTQGAMGLIYWIGYRCSKDYAEKVIFPVTKEISCLSDFLLGKWENSLVTTLVNKKDQKQLSTKIIKIYKLPIISTCVRKNGKGERIIIAVNNTPKDVKAQFKLNIKKSPEQVKELISGKTIEVKKSLITDSLSPYGVRVYRF